MNTDAITGLFVHSQPLNAPLHEARYSAANIHNGAGIHPENRFQNLLEWDLAEFHDNTHALKKCPVHVVNTVHPFGHSINIAAPMHDFYLAE